MVCGRVIVTARDGYWLNEAIRATTGLATSIIGCDAEAGVELYGVETPDGRPGASILIFARSLEKLGKSLIKRIGQGAMTCPTTAVFNGFTEGEPMNTGRRIRYFGDGYESLKTIYGRNMWSVPVTEGEFLVEEVFRAKEGLAGGAFIIMARSAEPALDAVKRAREAIAPMPGVILPFPGGAARCASKVGSKRYPFLTASTNGAFCPELRGTIDSRVPEGVQSALEIVIDGVDGPSVRNAMRAGIMAACGAEGVVKITSAEFGGQLGDVKIPLRSLFEG